MKTSDRHDLAANVLSSNGSYPVWVGWDILDGIGERIQGVYDPSVIYIISDDRLDQHVRKVQIVLERCGIETHIFFMPSGESNKTLKTVQHVYRWLAAKKAERGHMIVGVGGGVVGDLAGFVASTYLRGLKFGLVPTTLLAMMDASIGGKVAIDLPEGKNLVGSFYQPVFVLSDVKLLRTLPSRELTSGWAEAIKHGLILDSSLLEIFEGNITEIKTLEPDWATEIIRKSVSVKANVVSQDEKETMGLRILLNYGHTVGHALEVVTGFGRYLHGEAVSIGMMAAAHISRSMDLLSDDDVRRQERILRGYGLPIDFSGIEIETILEAMKSDKKTSDGSINWVLLDEIGHSVTSDQVPQEFVNDALLKVRS